MSDIDFQWAFIFIFGFPLCWTNCFENWTSSGFWKIRWAKISEKKEGQAGNRDMLNSHITQQVALKVRILQLETFCLFELFRKLYQLLSHYEYYNLWTKAYITDLQLLLDDINT